LELIDTKQSGGIDEPRSAGLATASFDGIAAHIEESTFANFAGTDQKTNYHLPYSGRTEVHQPSRRRQVERFNWSGSEPNGRGFITERAMVCGFSEASKKRLETGAKPIIDILLGAPSLRLIEAKIPALVTADYQYMPEHERAAQRMTLAFTRSPSVPTPAFA
jgi:hypothetical protein